MQFSDKTKKVLDYFSDINPGLLLEPGETICTVDPSKAIFVKAKLDQEFDAEAGIYNLKNFIRMLELFDGPNVEFEDKRFKISDSKQTVHYTYASKDMIFTPTRKDIKMPSEDVVLTVNWEDMSKTLEAAGILGMDKVAISGDGNAIHLEVYDPKNSTSDRYSVELEADSVPDEEFRILIKTSNIRLMPDNYEVTISLGKIVRFKSEGIEYYVAPEKE